MTPNILICISSGVIGVYHWQWQISIKDFLLKIGLVKGIVSFHVSLMQAEIEAGMR